MIIPGGAEPELLTLSARGGQEPVLLERARRLVESGINWGRVVRAAHAQGMGPLLLRTVSEAGPSDAVPGPVLAELRARAEAQLGHNRELIAELLHTLAALQAADVPAIAYKGPEHAPGTYGSLALRPFGDVDVLLRKRDVPRAKAALLSTGRYRLTREYAFSCHINVPTVRVDLHWMLGPRWEPMLAGFDELLSRAALVPVEGGQVMTLAAEDLLLVLAIEFGRDCRMRRQRLIQLCDTAALIRSHPRLDWDAVIARARATGAARMLLLDLWLARELAGAPLPGDVVDLIRREPVMERLAQPACIRLFAEAAGDAVEAPDATGRAFYLSLRERTRDKTAFLAGRAADQLALALAPSDRDRAFVRLPRSLDPLYLLVRPVRVLWQLARTGRLSASREAPPQKPG